MNKILYFLVVTSLLTACGSSKKSRSTTQWGNWQQNTVIADGNDEEWKKPLIYNSTRDKLSYSITNDDKNLYVVMKTSSEPLQLKILQSGLTVWINTTGQKKTSAGIQFPVGNETNKGVPEQGQFSPQSDIGQVKKLALEKLKTYQLYGFGTTIDNSYAVTNTNPAGIQIGINLNALKELVYETIIPINSLYINQQAPPNAALAIFAVGFFIPGIAPPNRPDGMNGGPPPGGRFDGPPPGGMDRPDRNAMQDLFSDTKVWQLILLAPKPVQ